MTVKVLDFSLIADKALDIYAESVVPELAKSDSARSYSCVKSSVSSVFEKVFSDTVSLYSSRYDVTYAVVPCFPIMRMNGVCSIVTRLICNDSEYLRKLGISSNQFIELFEKFIQSKCDGEATTLSDGKFVILKSNDVLLSDWKQLIVEKYGSSLVDLSVSEPFDSNPGFIAAYENDLSIYRKLDEFSEYKAKQLLERA